MNMKKILNPSGLTELYHSEKCALKRHDGCICAVARKMRERVSVAALLASKEWRGSSVKPCERNGRPANKLTHPSGAVAYIYA